MRFRSPGPGGRGALAWGGCLQGGRREETPSGAPPARSPTERPPPRRTPSPAAVMGSGPLSQTHVCAQRAGPGARVNLGQRPLCPEPLEARASRACAVVSDQQPALASPPLSARCLMLRLLQEALQTSPRPVHGASPSPRSAPTTKANEDAALRAFTELLLVYEGPAAPRAVSAMVTRPASALSQGFCRACGMQHV